MTDLIERVLRRVGAARTYVLVPPSTSAVRRASRRVTARVRAYVPPHALSVVAGGTPAARSWAALRVRPYAASAPAHIRIGVPDWHEEFDLVAEGAFAGVSR